MTSDDGRQFIGALDGLIRSRTTGAYGEEYARKNINIMSGILGKVFTDLERLHEAEALLEVLAGLRRVDTPEVEEVGEAATRAEAIQRLRAGNRGAGARLTNQECTALLSLLVEADAYISHMYHRGRWPDNGVEQLIGELRRAS